MWCVAQFGTICTILKTWKHPATLLKLTHFHGCFSRFLNCTNGTKSRNASHMWTSCKSKSWQELDITLEERFFTREEYMVNYHVYFQITYKNFYIFSMTKRSSSCSLIVLKISENIVKSWTKLKNSGRRKYASIFVIFPKSLR